MNGARFDAASLLLVAAGVLLLVTMRLLDAPGFYAAYLAGYLFWLGLSLGPLALYMIGRVSGGSWSELLHEPFLAAGGVLPVLALLFVPLALGMPSLYDWYPQAAAQTGKSAYLDNGFFLLRALLCLATWVILAWWLAHHARAGGGRRVSALGLVLLALTGTVAVIDWVMSLLPSWYSTVFGAQVLIAQLLQGACLAVLVTSVGRFRGRLGDRERLDLGNLMLLFTLLWAYLAFSDYLTIWIADLPEETRWYRLRLTGGWAWAGPTLALAMFVIPFFALLFRSLKQHRRWLPAVALLLLAATLLNALWLTLPSIGRGGWQAVVVTPALGAVWYAVFRWRLQQQRLITRRMEAEVG